MKLYFFFFNDTATTEIYTLSLHDALPICGRHEPVGEDGADVAPGGGAGLPHLQLGAAQRALAQREARLAERQDRKSTRLNSSHANISYAVFCLKKKKTAYFMSTHNS